MKLELDQQTQVFYAGVAAAASARASMSADGWDGISTDAQSKVFWLQIGRASADKLGGGPSVAELLPYFIEGASLRQPTHPDVSNDIDVYSPTSAADVLSDPYMLDEIARTLNCGEANALASLLAYHGAHEGARSLLRFHAEGDEPDDSHYDMRFGRALNS